MSQTLPFKPGTAAPDGVAVQAVGLAAAAALVGVSLMALHLRLSVQIAIVAASVALLGVPHGALDPLLWTEPARRSRRPSLVWLGLLAAYIALAGVAVLPWLLAPSLALTGFLALSVLHFGLGEVEGSAGWAEVVLLGAMPIVLTWAGRPGEVGALFSSLTGDSGWGTLSAPVSLGLAGAWAGLLLCQRSRRSDLGRGLVLRLSTAPLFLLAPPLLSFAVFFCLWHAPRHLLDVGRRLEVGRRVPWRRAVVVGIGFSLLAVLGAAAGFVLLTRAYPRPVGLLRATFWGIAAVTVPHMLATALSTRPGPPLRLGPPPTPPPAP